MLVVLLMAILMAAIFIGNQMTVTREPFVPTNRLDQKTLPSASVTSPWASFHYTEPSMNNFYQTPWLQWQRPWEMNRESYLRNNAPTYYSIFNYSYDQRDPVKAAALG